MLTQLRQLAGVLDGHAWTVLADARHRVRPTAVPPWTPWSTTVHTPDGAVRLSGKLAEVAEATDAVLVVHGLGGSADSGYCRTLARAAADQGWSSLRLNLRGADGQGEDVYHAGLIEDLRAALESPALASYARLHVVGVSLGGHVSLRLAVHGGPRLAGVVAVSAPLDLATSCDAIDRRRAYPYRHHVLDALKEAYRGVARRNPPGPRLPAPLQTVEALQTIRGWDDRVVVPRHGFADVADYHSSMSVGPHLRALTCPALYVGSPFDPMVPGHTVTPSLDAAGSALRTVMLPRGGHVGLPAPALCSDASPTLPAQLLAWLRAPD